MTMDHNPERINVHVNDDWCLLQMWIVVSLSLYWSISGLLLPSLEPISFSMSGGGLATVNNTKRSFIISRTFKNALI